MLSCLRSRTLSVGAMEEVLMVKIGLQTTHTTSQCRQRNVESSLEKVILIVNSIIALTGAHH